MPTMLVDKKNLCPVIAWKQNQNMWHSTEPFSSLTVLLSPPFYMTPEERWNPRVRNRAASVNRTMIANKPCDTADRLHSVWKAINMVRGMLIRCFTEHCSTTKFISNYCSLCKINGHKYWHFSFEWKNIAAAQADIASWFLQNNLYDNVSALTMILIVETELM